MKSIKSIILFSLILSFFTNGYIYSQEVNIIPYLKQIESGKKKEVKTKLQQLIKQYPSNPSVMFLAGVMTENGQDAVAVFKKIVKNYPHSKYADAALYRIYTYYYAIGLYKSAKTFLTKLKREYPNSPYLNIAEKNIPNRNDTTDIEINIKKHKGNTSKAVKTTLKDEQHYRFTIQAGAFSNPGNAIALKKDFIDSGYFSDISVKIVAGATFHVVYVGKFFDRAKAENFLKIINKVYNLNGIIISTNK